VFVVHALSPTARHNKTTGITYSLVVGPYDSLLSSWCVSKYVELIDWNSCWTADVKKALAAKSSELTVTLVQWGSVSLHYSPNSCVGVCGFCWPSSERMVGNLAKLWDRNAGLVLVVIQICWVQIYEHGLRSRAWAVMSDFCLREYRKFKYLDNSCPCWQFV